MPYRYFAFDPTDIEMEPSTGRVVLHLFPNVNAARQWALNAAIRHLSGRDGPMQLEVSEPRRCQELPGGYLDVSGYLVRPTGDTVTMPSPVDGHGLRLALATDDHLFYTDDLDPDRTVAFGHNAGGPDRYTFPIEGASARKLMAEAFRSHLAGKQYVHFEWDANRLGDDLSAIVARFKEQQEHEPEAGQMSQTDQQIIYNKGVSQASRTERKVIHMPEQTQNDIRIKEPTAPASDAQMNLISDLAEKGIISSEEMVALGTSPTKQEASDLISAHAEEEGFKAVQEARRAVRAAARPPRQSQTPGHEGGKASFAHVKIPAAFVHPYTYTAKDGRTFEKAYVDFPKGTVVNGIDIGGFSTDVFLNDRMKQQMLAGEQPTLSFKSDEPVAIWTGSKQDTEHAYKRFEVNPWDLCKGVKANNEAFKAAKAAERESAKTDGISLKEEASAMRDSANALASRDDDGIGDRSDMNLDEDIPF